MVTGAARGIGAETARRLAARGAKLALVGLEPEELASVARQCGPDALAIEADVTDLPAMEDAVVQTVERFGGLDVLVANAGVASFGNLRTIDPEAFYRTIEVNLLGQFRTVRAGLEQVIDRRGYVLVVASAAAVSQIPGFSAYGASKAGVEGMCNALRLEVAHLGVDVGVAYFSWIDTDMVARGAEQEGFRVLMDRLPGPIAKVTPLPDVGLAMADAIERRARVVAVPEWVRAARYLRGLLHTTAAERQIRAAAPAIASATEAEVERRGPAAASMFGGAGDTESSKREHAHAS